MDDTYEQIPPAEPEPVRTQHSPRILLPILLFLATCWSTWDLGGWTFSVPLMTILLTHELGHFLQAKRYSVPASLPYFIPLPASLIGTMGAVIFMQSHRGDRRTLFDIGITGPLAGLVPTLIFCVLGLHLSHVEPIAAQQGRMSLGEPLLFKFLAHSILGPLPEGSDITLHPVAYAGWVGIFITALNLIPIGQLDGGHVLYALLLRRAHIVAQALLLGAVLGVIVMGYWGWTLMILFLMFIGPVHPPTADDTVPLGTARTILGWASLLFVPIGFTPVPFSF
jgi:membrane-associated protease RseP (regulator of RpoE activity)